MKKRVLAALLTLATAFSFVACGNSEENGEAGNEVIVQDVKDVEDVEADGVIYFSEFFSPDVNNICYCIEEEGAKDSVIHEVYVFRDGQAWMYPVKELKIPLELGDVAKMTDDEVIESLDAAIQEIYSKEIEACEQLLTMDINNEYTGYYGSTYTGLSEFKNAVTEYKQNLENFDARTDFALTDFVYEVYTDDTGNYAEEEYVCYKQNSRYLSWFGFAQRAVNANPEYLVENILGIAEDGEYRSYILTTLDENRNVTDCEIRYMEEPKEVHEKIWAAERTQLISGRQRIYDTYYGGFYIYDYYVLSRSSMEEGKSESTHYWLDTVETADVVDKEEPYSR